MMLIWCKNFLHNLEAAWTYLAFGSLKEKEKTHTHTFVYRLSGNKIPHNLHTELIFASGPVPGMRPFSSAPKMDGVKENI